MAAEERTALVLYGSETGNAQDMAEEVGRLCSRLRFRTQVDELDAVDLSSLLQHQLVIFVISTTGQGDMPRNSLLFWKKLLRKRLPPGCLEQLNFTCFGLGDSTYIKFNWAARKLIRRLEQLGARPFFEHSEADEQFTDGIEGAFSAWSDRLYKHILEEYPHPEGLQLIPENTPLPPRWSLAPALRHLHNGTNGVNGINGINSINGDHADHDLPNSRPDLSRLIPVPDGWCAILADNQRLTPSSHWQDVRLLSFDIAHRPSGETISCNPGDCLTIFPKNSPEDVDKLINLLGWQSVADQTLDLSLCSSLPRRLFAPHPCTIRNILLENVDITAIPRRSFLRNLSYFARDQDQRERLLEFTQLEFIDEYFDYATRTRRSILEVLEEFHSVHLPPERLLDIFPLIHGRDFSIANGASSSSDASTTRVDLLVALVRYRTLLRKPREGLCSRYLASLPLPSRLQITHKAALSPIHGPQNAQRPLVAMATGTGIAPVRCLIHERLSHPNPAPTYLFFGNRNQSADYFFEEEWKALISDGKPLKVFTAFSRDQEKKVYVQHLLKQESELMAELIPQNAIFAICGGSTKMADACKEAVFEPYRTLGDTETREKELAALTWWQEIW